MPRTDGGAMAVIETLLPPERGRTARVGLGDLCADLWVGSWAAKPQNRRKLVRSSIASVSVTSDRPCRTASSSDLDIARSGRARGDG